MRFSKFLFVLLLGIFTQNLKAQTKIEHLQKAEDSLAVLFNKLFAFDGVRYTCNDAEKNHINMKLVHLFQKILADKASFSYPFKKLNKISILSDKHVRIYTWDTQLDNHTHVYHGFIQYKPRKKKMYLYQLIDKSDSIQKPLYRKLTSDNWYGCLYYQMVPKKYKGKYYYTLIGWDGNDLLTSKKIIDVLTFTRSGKPRFGKKIFMINQRPKPMRIIYEFSAKLTMVIHYDNKRDTLYMDHLSPAKPFYKGMYQFYGPDFSYDGLFFKNGKWYLTEDVRPRDARFRQSEPAKTEHPLFYKPR